ncbi:four helix bundle protein [Oleiharenicola lentus]|uniref:Four helix bundle protein n=1 Tax=Oleiharenicola lentus TaxID=2508720 RepID=A0A4Q1CA70_9BACT|nr:four helix bundle protein [Oleiharenicola lentus]RXK55766.1 four helix bundle protein [Oleiharenicola lentus]
MTETELKTRTKAFALRVLKLIDSLPDTRSGRVLAGQLGRSGTSVGANYRSACRSRSTAEMISKLSIVEEEADESAFWLELIGDHRLLDPQKVAALHQEAGELTAIMVASRRTLAKRSQKSRIENPKSKI